jgi:hypothetical protein
MNCRLFCVKVGGKNDVFRRASRDPPVVELLRLLICELHGAVFKCLAPQLHRTVGGGRHSMNYWLSHTCTVHMQRTSPLPVWVTGVGVARAEKRRQSMMHFYSPVADRDRQLYQDSESLLYFSYFFFLIPLKGKRGG